MSTFNEIQDGALRTYNRAVFASNLNKDAGAESATRYLMLFSDREKTAIHLMLKYINKFGVEEVKREIIKKINGGK